jgi:hypothetical protein
MQAQPQPDCSTSLFGLLLSQHRHERGLDLLGFRAMCQESGEVELKGICCTSISNYELGKFLPLPDRAKALVRLLEDPDLLQVYHEDRLLSNRGWKAKAGLTFYPKSHGQAVSRAKRGRPLPEATHQAALLANSIQDEFFGLGTRQWRRQERKKKKTLEKHLAKRSARLKELARLAALRSPVVSPEGLDLYTIDTWGEEVS